VLFGIIPGLNGYRGNDPVNIDCLVLFPFDDVSSLVWYLQIFQMIRVYII
jgi:hypothetical protein